MKILRLMLIGILVIFLIGTVGLVGWATVRTQEATERAVEVLQENGIQREDGQLVFRPDSPTKKGLIYYPGGLVDPEAYAVTAQGIADAGYLVVIPKMPLNLAFAGINRADTIRSDFPEIETWVIGGHSLGGAMAAEYAKNNVDNLDGLIMYASYPANNEDFVDFPIPILTIMGSRDPGTPQQEAFYEAISDSAERFVVEGGNHRQYADYTYQPDDGIATISAAVQQEQIIAATVQFLDTLE
ncbi:MAG: alpha/beta hydrolase [Chloroflexi bacterium]|jgi:dienelactone hydrolase|nr:alpha/beta hydrolase [Chloroflexota bacterium]